MKTNHRECAWTQRRSATMAAAAMLACATSGVACTDAVSTAINPCPCADGYVCCDSGVCAKDQNLCAAATQALSQSIQGTWDGYFETPGSGNFGPDDSLRITISVDPSGTLSGTVTLGTGPVPPPPTDNTMAWPPGYDFSLSYLPGFHYAAQNLRWDSGRLRFDIGSREPWKDWCAAQTSYSHPEYSVDWYNCVPGGDLFLNPDGTCTAVACDGTYNESGVCSGPVTRTPFDCGRAYACAGVCGCDANGCRAGEADTLFDIALRNGYGDGSSSVSVGNIRLMQVSH